MSERKKPDLRFGSTPAFYIGKKTVKEVEEQR